VDKNEAGSSSNVFSLKLYLFSSVLQSRSRFECSELVSESTTTFSDPRRIRGFDMLLFDMDVLTRLFKH
jgi:hypothetical protein